MCWSADHSVALHELLLKHLRITVKLSACDTVRREVLYAIV